MTVKSECGLFIGKSGRNLPAWPELPDSRIKS